MKAKYIIWTVVGILLLSFGYYTISPLFISIKADEASPETVPKTSDVSLSPQIKSTPVTGTSGHPASGVVRVVEAEGKRYIRYENFKTINGPDIYVYLAKNLDAKEFVNLGRVKANEGNINYEIPAGVNMADYPYVLTWCKAFGVLFNYADLSLAR